MSFSVGIIGLPNAGKSTLFSVLTKKQVEIANYPFTTIEPNVGIVPVPDKRLEEISKIVNPQKTIKTVIKFVDIAGLVKGAHKGEGLGNQFLSHIRACNVLVEVIRAFENQKVEHIEQEINPKKDAEIIETELLIKDIQTLEKIIEKTKKTEAEKARTLIEIRNLLEKKKPFEQINLSEKEKKIVNEYQLLTLKPKIYLLNIDKEKPTEKEINLKKIFPSALLINLKIEKEIEQLSPEEMKELQICSRLDQLISACYNILDLITFYTIAGGKEARAWSLKRNSDILKAAEKVHSDFKEKFIKAEIINWKTFIQKQGWSKTKEEGLIKIVGKEYIVQDGDIIEFKI